jgi:hypothetical protein
MDYERIEKPSFPTQVSSPIPPHPPLFLPLASLSGGATDARCCSLLVFCQGGGFSPKRLRAMLLGVERRRKDAGAGDDDDGEQEEEYGAVPMASVRSDAADSDARSEHPCPCPHCSALLDWGHFLCQYSVQATVPVCQSPASMVV